VNAPLSEGKDQLPLPWDAADPAARLPVTPSAAPHAAALGPAPSYSETPLPYRGLQGSQPQVEVELGFEDDLELDLQPSAELEPEPEVAPRRRFPRVDWEQVHMAMPRLLGQAAYTPPRRWFEPTSRPFDPDDLPLEAEREEDPRFMGAALAEGESVGASSGGVGLRLTDNLPVIGSFLRRSRS
jgi:hypothetical protein